MCCILSHACILCAQGTPGHELSCAVFIHPLQTAKLWGLASLLKHYYYCCAHTHKVHKQRCHTTTNVTLLVQHAADH